MNNRFFAYDDPKIENLIFPLEPKFWWSRLFEYKKCLDFVGSKDIVLDAACGIEHSFKFALTDICKKVYACDLEDVSEENIINAIALRFGQDEADKFNKEYFKKVHFTQCNIASLPYPDNFFDKVYCISSIEHCDEPTILLGLKEFKRVLKDDPNARIIITADFPAVPPWSLMDMAKEVGLQIDDEYDYSLNARSITTTYFGSRIYCFSMVLKK